MEKNEMTFKSVNLRDPYIVDEESKCLRQLRLTKIVYDLITGETMLTWLEAETGKLIHGDLSDRQVYGGEEQFKKGELLKCGDIYCSKTFYEIINYAIPNNRVCIDGQRLFSWVYENGVAARFYYDERISSITTTYGSDGSGKMEIKTDVEIPCLYHNAEEVYDFNDYEIVNNDGTKTFHEGVCRRLKLTEEQEVLVGKLQEMIDECLRAKIKMCFDFYDYRLLAFNMENIECVGYDPCYNEETEVAHCLNLCEAMTISGIDDINTDDCSYQFVVRKDSLKTSRQ